MKQKKLFKIECENSWFQEALANLNVNEEAGWPDKFGEQFYEWVRSNKFKKIKTLSLFSGGGGLDIAFHDMGFDIVECMEPKQNIRLHKGGAGNNSFSWQNGISMRTLDKKYVTPALRKYELLNLNADGFMMTRSLAENYPYSPLYKAKLRGAREEWLAIVEALEAGTTDPLNALKYFISLLFKKTEHFQLVSNKLIKLSNNFLVKKPSKDEIVNLIKSHINKSGYSARLLEISMHALMQAALHCGAFPLVTLKPLSQMRSANMKHGNVGDIELLQNDAIIESWDAKYGKAYLRDEIDEVMGKVAEHDDIVTLGFVTTVKPTKNKEICNKIADYKDTHGIAVQVITFEEWIKLIYSRVIPYDSSEADLSAAWLTAYVESLAQKRREMAPIDEPCIEWVSELKAMFQKVLESVSVGSQ